MADHEARERRAAVRQIVRTARVSSQEDLRLRLAKRGFDVTQATLSRDLAQLRARRVTLPDEGSVYEIDALPSAGGQEELERMGSNVVAVDDNATLVVVVTAAGAASAVALALDRARLDEVLGTIAGDDTIFVAPARTSSAAALSKLLKKTWKKKGET